MRNKQEKTDALLKRALCSAEKPDPVLVQKVKYQLIRREPVMRNTSAAVKRSFSMALAAALAFIIIGTAAFAAWTLRRPGEIVGDMGDQTLGAAFDSDKAIDINASISSGGYTFTMMSVLSGRDMTDQPFYSPEVQDERTYAVMAIQKTDGNPMPGPDDAAYSHTPFFVTPLVKGVRPWELNISTMNGGYIETVADGILYRLVECDTVEIFADRGLYLAVSSSALFDKDAFQYNESTGEITANKGYSGACALFPLALDKALANPEKAQEYLDGLFAPPSDAEEADEMPDPWKDVDWDEAQPVASTVKELSVGADGMLSYTFSTDEYGGGTVTAKFSDCFSDEKKAQSSIVQLLASGDSICAVRFSMDEAGVITGAIVVPK